LVARRDDHEHDQSGPGVSVTTVSHALNHPERVTAELRARVQEAVDALGYAPNPSARSLRTGRTNLVALVIPDICNPFFPELARAVQDELAAAGYDTLIFNTDTPGSLGQRHAEGTLLQLSPKRFDAARIVDEAVRSAIPIPSRLPLPTVHIGYLDEPTVDTVTFDDEQAAYDATAYLVRRGHRQIGQITGDQRLWSGQARLGGFRRALAEAGLEADERLIYRGSYLRQSGADGMRALMELERPPTAIYIANALMAIAALGVALDMGRRVPDDVAVVAQDEIVALSDVRPRLTTVAGSAAAIGAAAARRILQRLQGQGPARPQQLVLPHELIVRESA
jgi:LacI family transcriptional regulator